MPQQVDTTFRWLFYLGSWPENKAAAMVAERVNDSNALVGRIEYGIVRENPLSGREVWGLIKYAGGTRMPYAGKTWGRDQDGWDKAIASCVRQIDSALGYASWEDAVMSGALPAPAREGVPPRPDDERTICENCERGWGQHNGWSCLDGRGGEWEPWLPSPAQIPSTPTGGSGSPRIMWNRWTP